MKQIVKNFNNLIIERIFKVRNKTNNKFNISNFNKYLIAFISLLFFYLFYLSIPVLYDKTWLQSHLESQLLKEFKINFSTSSNISYRILPTPHFLIKDSKIFKNHDNKAVSLVDIKNLKLFVSQKNFFEKKNITLDHIKISDANFSLLRDDIKLLKDNSSNNFSNKKIEVNNSSIFFKDNSGNVITIIKISKAFFIPDNENLLNLFDVRGKVFNIPFIFNAKNKLDTSSSEEVKITAKLLKLNIFDEYNDEENSIGVRKNIISFLNSTLNTDYKIERDILIFNSKKSKLKSKEINYNGKLSINPFDLNLNINIDNYEVFDLLNIHSIMNELIKTELLFNNNISINASINSNFSSKKSIFQNAKIYFNIINGKINFNKTKLINKKVVLLELENSDLSFKNDKLILSTDIMIDIKNSDELFSLLQTNKKFRKPIKNIVFNLEYDLLSKQIKFDNFKIENNEVNNEFLIMIEGLNDNNNNNWNKSRRLLNSLLEIYEG